MPRPKNIIHIFKSLQPVKNIIHFFASVPPPKLGRSAPLSTKLCTMHEDSSDQLSILMRRMILGLESDLTTSQIFDNLNQSWWFDFYLDYDDYTIWQLWGMKLRIMLSMYYQTSFILFIKSKNNMSQSIHPFFWIKTTFHWFEDLMLSVSSIKLTVGLGNKLLDSY